MRKLILLNGFLFICFTLHAQQQSLLSIGVPDSLYSETLHETRTIYLQFPENYAPGNTQKYPVVYILDGEFFLPTVSDVQHYYSGGYTPEMILVGISNSKNRTRDLTPSEIKEKYGMPFNEENGKAESFLTFLKDELIPYIERAYPVTSYRTLIGHSYGGLFTCYTLLHSPKLFANYLAIDPSLDWDNQSLLRDAEEFLPLAKLKNKALYISLSGQLHMQNPDITIQNVMKDTSDFTLFARSNIEFSELTKKFTPNGLKVHWEFFPGEIHGTIPFPSIRNGLVSMYNWYQMEHTDKFNSPVTQKDELYKIVRYRAAKLESHFGYTVPPYPEDLLNMLGYMNLDMEQAEKSKMFFEFGIEYFPESANSYDSMADYYERQNDLVNALHFVGKAYEISGSEYHQNRIQHLEDLIKNKK